MYYADITNNLRIFIVLSSSKLVVIIYFLYIVITVITFTSVTHNYTVINQTLV